MTDGDLSSGVILTPSCLKSAMLSANVRRCPLVGPAYTLPPAQTEEGRALPMFSGDEATPGGAVRDNRSAAAAV